MDKLKILFVEDSIIDVELSARVLQKGGLHFEIQRVDRGDEFSRMLDEFMPNLILSDFSMPLFDSVSALEMAKEKCPAVPFIFVSGTIGEERAIESLKRGATDYVLKSNLARLVPCVQRALKESQESKARRDAEKELAHQRTFFRQVIDLNPSFIFAKDREGRFVLVNQAVADAYGTAVERVLGKTDADFNTNEEEVRHFRKIDMEVMDSLHDLFIAEERVTDASGRLRWVQTVKRPIVGPDGSADMVLGVATDITDRKTQEQRIARLNRIHEVLSGINSAIVRIRGRQELFREACRIAVEHGQFCMAWIGLGAQDQARVMPLVCMDRDNGYLDEVGLSVDRLAQDDRAARRALRGRKAVVVNDIANDPHVLYKEDAQARGYRSLVVLPLLVRGEPKGVLALYASEKDYFDHEEMKLLTELAGDISFGLEIIEKDDKLDYLAYYDVLTGLPNRTLFCDRVNQSAQSAQLNASRMAVLAVDIERLSMINETFGRQAGDDLLKRLTQRLGAEFDGSGWLARANPDAFAVVLERVSNESDLARVLEEKVFPCLARPLSIADQDLRLSAKAGIALFPNDGQDADTLWKNAEAALRKAKASGDRYLFYMPEMNAKVSERLALENKLHIAQIEEQFVLHYQPKFELRSGKVSGMEALLRWQSPELGLVSPAMFVPILEETGMILDVGKWALKRAACDYLKWQAKGINPPAIAVNVSALQLRQKDFPAVVRDALQYESKQPQLDIEITESVIMEDIEQHIPRLHTIREAPMGIAIDDFGTGYSSLSYLAKLPVTALKIDRAFIENMASNADSMAIVSTIISLAHALQLKVIAEGVETEEQSRLLKLLKCDEAQGFLFCRPLAPEHVEAVFHTETKTQGSPSPAI